MNNTATTNANTTANTTTALSAVEYAFKNGIRLWIPAVHAECTPAEISEGEIESRSHQQASGMNSDVTVNSTPVNRRVYNKWNPLMVKAGYPSPLEKV
jgi:hypothetical protein